jgi:hypothetical protein
MEYLKDYDRDETYLGFDGLLSITEIVSGTDEMWEIEQQYDGDGDGDWAEPDAD